MSTRRRVLNYLRRELDLLKKIGTPEERAEVPGIEAELDRIEAGVSFATNSPEVEKPQGEKGADE